MTELFHRIAACLSAVPLFWMPPASAADELQTAAITEALKRSGTLSDWTPTSYAYHADDHTGGHAKLDTHLLDPSRKERLALIRDRLTDLMKRFSHLLCQIALASSSLATAVP
jgi:hypothetical protein